MNNYKFGDGGFNFIETIINHLKVSWKTYLIIFLLGLVPALVCIGIPTMLIGASFLTGSVSGLVGSVVLFIILSIIAMILSLPFTAAIIKCANEVDIEANYAPTASDCIKFGFSKLAKLLIFGLVMALISIVLFLLFGLISGILITITFGIGVIIITPLSIAIGGLYGIIILIAQMNIVIKDMGTIESLTNAVNKIKDGLKENIIFFLKLALIYLVVYIVSFILGLVPIVGYLVSSVIGGIVGISVTISILYRFFKVEY